jgi:tripartite-type tricarboxylate transporter receptor subunit TctC
LSPALGPVLDHNGLTQDRRKPLSQPARANVGHAASTTGTMMRNGLLGQPVPCSLTERIGVPSVQCIPGSGGPATRELLAGKVDYFCSNVAAIKPHIEAGRQEAPTVFPRVRLASLSGVATAQEQGLKDFEASNWLALFLPAATPDPIVARLNAAAVAPLADQTLQTKLRALGAQPVTPDRNTQERLSSFLARERDKWGYGHS